MFRFYCNLWFASERYLIFRFSKDWCLIFFLNMGDLLFEQKIWLKVNFMVLYNIPKSSVQSWVFPQNCSKSSQKIKLYTNISSFSWLLWKCNVLIKCQNFKIFKTVLKCFFSHLRARQSGLKEWYSGQLSKILKILDLTLGCHKGP